MAALVYVCVSGGMENLLTGDFVAAETPGIPEGLFPADNLFPSDSLYPAGA